MEFETFMKTAVSVRYPNQKRRSAKILRTLSVDHLYTFVKHLDGDPTKQIIFLSLMWLTLSTRLVSLPGRLKYKEMLNIHSMFGEVIAALLGLINNNINDATFTRLSTVKTNGPDSCQLLIFVYTALLLKK